MRSRAVTQDFLNKFKICVDFVLPLRQLTLIVHLINTNMKKITRLVALIVAMLCLPVGSKAQNLQVLYDLAPDRNYITTTFEMFRPDAFGSTFCFVDMDYNEKAIGAYTEIAREFCFWQDTELNWLSAHAEFNGGLAGAYSFNNAWLLGLIIFGIRPEDIYDDEDHLNATKNVVTITVDVAELLGATTNVHFDMNGNHVCAAVAARADIRIGDKIKFAIDMEKCHFFNPANELCVTVPFYKEPAKAE